MRCRGLKEGDLPEGEWLCPECVRTFGDRRQYEGRADGPVVNTIFAGPWTGPEARFGNDVALELSDIVTGLRANKFASAFGLPVADADGSSDYYDTVTRPMDLGTVAAKLASRAYYGSGVGGDVFDAARVVQDVRLVFHNCKAYNRHMSTIWRMADVLSREFETALRDRVRLTPAQAQRAAALYEHEAATALKEEEEEREGEGAGGDGSGSVGSKE
jgi:hypothetical protein